MHHQAPEGKGASERQARAASNRICPVSAAPFTKGVERIGRGFQRGCRSGRRSCAYAGLVVLFASDPQQRDDCQRGEYCERQLHAVSSDPAQSESITVSPSGPSFTRNLHRLPSPPAVKTSSSSPSCASSGIKDSAGEQRWATFPGRLAVGRRSMRSVMLMNRTVANGHSRGYPRRTHQPPRSSSQPQPSSPNPPIGT